MIAQLKDQLISLFERRYPDHQVVLLFDNATNHASYTEEALRPEGLDPGPGGVQPLLLSGFNLRTQYPQSMQDSRGVARGMKRI